MEKEMEVIVERAIAQAENEKAAHLKAYDTHDHLMHVTVTEKDEENECWTSMENSREPA